jgi:hypothetical protein
MVEAVPLFRSVLRLLPERVLAVLRSKMDAALLRASLETNPLCVSAPGKSLPDRKAFPVALLTGSMVDTLL